MRPLARYPLCRKLVRAMARVGAVRRGREGHELADQGAGVGVAFEGGRGVRELARLGEEGGYGGDSVRLK